MNHVIMANRMISLITSSTTDPKWTQCGHFYLDLVCLHTSVKCK